MSFPITCTACQKTFTISDEIYEKKIAGRVVTIKCKSCGQGIRVDGLAKGGSAPAPVPAPAAAPAPAPPAAGPASTAEGLWAVDYSDGQDREFTTAEVVAELERGAVERTTLVWREGMEEWLELHQVPELAAALAKLEAKKKAAAAKVAPVHKPRAPMPTVTGLAGLPGALKPRAQQPSTPELPKPRAQQPSAPVLPKPKPASPPMPPPLAASPTPPPFAAVSPPPFAAPTPPPMPVAAPPAPPPPLPTPALLDATPPLPASVAKVVSAPPQLQPAFPLAAPSPTPTFATGPAVVTDHASVEWPESKSKAPKIIGALVVAAALAGGAFVLLGGQEAPPPPTTPISALPPTPATTPTPATPAPAATPAAASPGPEGSDTASGSDPVATGPDQGTTPGAGFAELFAAGARKAESKGATVSTGVRFDAAATKAPLAEAATQAQACKQSGGPTGKVTVVVTFDPSGKVASATITEAPFAGTATGSCISSALKRASIAPFSGLPGTVSKTFSIL